MTLSDHLLPEDSPFHHWEIHGEYYWSIARRLLQELERRPVIATVVCLPAFEAEWAIRIHGSDKLGFAATLTKAQSQIWSAWQDAEIAVSRHDSTLSKNIADELLNIWSNMLREARYRASAPVGVDGVSYHFLCYKNTHGHLCGQTWSPDPETTAGHLVSLAHSLYDFVMADSSDLVRIESQLKFEIEWFRDIPIRPPLRENAVITLEESIKQSLEYHARGLITDTEAVGQIADAFDYVRYPKISEILDIIDLIPESMRKLIRATLKG